MKRLPEEALRILHEWVESESLRKHCYADRFAPLTTIEEEEEEEISVGMPQLVPA